MKKDTTLMDIRINLYFLGAEVRSNKGSKVFLG